MSGGTTMTSKHFKKQFCSYISSKVLGFPSRAVSHTVVMTPAQINEHRNENKQSIKQTNSKWFLSTQWPKVNTVSQQQWRGGDSSCTICAAPHDFSRALRRENGYTRRGYLDHRENYCDHSKLSFTMKHYAFRVFICLFVCSHTGA